EQARLTNLNDSQSPHQSHFLAIVASMSTGFEMAAEALRSQASRVHQHGDEYEAAVARLREGSGHWGEDGLFAALQLARAECRDIILAAVPGLSGTINSTQER